MARQKSALRKRMNIRWARHAVTRALARAAPALARRLNVPPFSVRAVDIATQVTEDRTQRIRFSAPAAIRDQVLIPAMQFDTGDASGNATGEADFWSQTAILDDCVVAGHTRSILRARDRALVNFRADPPNWNYGKAARLAERKASPGLHYVLGGGRHYYHFFGNEILPLMDYLERLHGREQKLCILTPSGLTGWQSDVLAALARHYPLLRFEALGVRELLTHARLLWNFRLHANYEWMPVDREAADRLKTMLADTSAPIPADAGKVFISPRDASIRQLRNEAELEKALAQRGFSTFVLGVSSLPEQIARFSAARTLVCVHGAALTNLLFCAPGARVIEIFPENFVKSTFCWLALRLGLDYVPVIGGPGNFDQDFSCDISAVLARIADA